MLTNKIKLNNLKLYLCNSSHVCPPFRTHAHTQLFSFRSDPPVWPNIAIQLPYTGGVRNGSARGRERTPRAGAEITHERLLGALPTDWRRRARPYSVSQAARRRGFRAHWRLRGRRAARFLFWSARAVLALHQCGARSSRRRCALRRQRPQA